jgi:arsenate reductase
MKKILVLCTGNSCRSQMAEGYLRHFAGNKAEVYSAGIETHGVNPNAIKFMLEDGIDISGHTSNNILEYLGIDFDFTITVCDHAKESCPVMPGTSLKFHHNFRDPSKVIGNVAQMDGEFIVVRNEIKDYCFRFIRDNLVL